MKILFLTRYGALGASSRVRLHQYVPFLEQAGFDVHVSALLSDKYLSALYSKRFRWFYVIAGYCRRAFVVSRARTFDIVVIEKELFPYCPAVIEKRIVGASRPYIIDIDDAVFHSYDQNPSWLVRRFMSQKIDQLFRGAAAVFAGNEYISNRAKFAGSRRVVLIPTVIDAEAYKAIERKSTAVLTVGWLGSPSTSKYLRVLCEMASNLKQQFNVRFVAVGADPGDVNDAFEVVEWSESHEINCLQAFDIGVMPLPDNPWERGKCGYKLIQYMACGIPVVASPVGVNLDLVENGRNGYLAETEDEWRKHLVELITLDSNARKEMGACGRLMVNKSFTLQVQAHVFHDEIVRALNSCAG